MKTAGGCPSKNFRIQVCSIYLLFKDVSLAQAGSHQTVEATSSFVLTLGPGRLLKTSEHVLCLNPSRESALLQGYKEKPLLLTQQTANITYFLVYFPFWFSNKFIVTKSSYFCIGKNENCGGGLPNVTHFPNDYSKSFWSFSWILIFSSLKLHPLNRLLCSLLGWLFIFLAVREIINLCLPESSMPMSQMSLHFIDLYIDDVTFPLTKCRNLGGLLLSFLLFSCGVMFPTSEDCSGRKPNQWMSVFWTNFLEPNIWGKILD